MLCWACFAPLVYPTRSPLAAQALHIGTQVARALAYLHPTILHRGEQQAANTLPMLHGSHQKLSGFGWACWW